MPRPLLFCNACASALTSEAVAKDARCRTAAACRLLSAQSRLARDRKRSASITVSGAMLMREPTRAVKLHTDAIAFFAPNRHTQAGKVGSTWLKRPASTSGTYSVRARARRAVGSRRVTREGDLRWSCAERDGHGSGSVKCTGQTSFHCPSRVVLSSGDIARPSGSSPGQNSEPRKNTWLCPLCPYKLQN